MALMFLSADDPAEEWRDELRARMPELDVRIWPEVGDPAEIDVALVWQPPPGELTRYPNLKAILSLGAGVDGLLADATLPPAVPLARMVDPSMTRGMTEYVLAAVLRHHRCFDLFAREQAAGRWRFEFPQPAAERRVGIMGLGELGTAAAGALAGQGFAVSGWSRSPKSIEGVTSYAGRSELHNFLHRIEILVCMLPLTAETRGILDAALFAELAHDAAVINVARGAHLIEHDLLAALDSGHLASATLDVFREEPLPPGHPFWAHPKVLITPHIASYCWPASAAGGVVENIRRVRRGELLAHQVDRARGY